MCMMIMNGDDQVPDAIKRTIETLSAKYPISDILNVYDRYVSRTSVDAATAEILESFDKESLNPGRAMILLIFGKHERVNKMMIADFITKRFSSDDIFFNICPIRNRTMFENALFMIGFLISMSARLVDYMIRAY